MVFQLSKIRTFDPTIFKSIKNWFLKRITSFFVQKRGLWKLNLSILRFLVLNQSPINTIPLITQLSWDPKFVLSGDPLYRDYSPLRQLIEENWVRKSCQPWKTSYTKVDYGNIYIISDVLWYLYVMSIRWVRHRSKRPKS